MAFSDNDVLDAIKGGNQTITAITIHLTGVGSSHGLSVNDQKEFYSRKQQVARRIHSLHRFGFIEPVSENGSGVVKWRVVE